MTVTHRDWPALKPRSHQAGVAHSRAPKNEQRECTLDDVAKALGISSQYASRLECQALKKLRAYLDEKGIGKGDL